MTVEPVTFALAPSMNIDTIVARRDACVAAIQKLEADYRAMHEIRTNIFGPDDHHDSRYDLRAEWGSTRRDIDDKEQTAEAIKRLDAECWDRLLKLSGLMQLMDAKIREEWREQLAKHEMPVFTRANINATFTSLAAQRGDIFERGVENVFRKLSSWDYKTNNPVKLGKRAIFKYACESRYWKRDSTWTFYGPNHEFADKLDDLMRVFYVLDGKPEPAHDQGAWHMLSLGRWMDNRREGDAEAPPRDADLHGYLKFRGFKNGNAHVTFLRLDLVDELNRIIAKRFPGALPPTRDSDQ